MGVESSRRCAGRALCWNDKGLVLVRTRQGSAGGEEALRAAKQQMNQCRTVHRAAHRHHSPGVLCTGDVLLCSQPGAVPAVSIRAWLHSEKQSKAEHTGSELVSRTLLNESTHTGLEGSSLGMLCSSAHPRKAEETRAGNQACCREQAGSSWPKEAKSLLGCKSRLDKAEPLEVRTLKNNSKLRKSPELKRVENRNTF